MMFKACSDTLRATVPFKHANITFSATYIVNQHVKHVILNIRIV